MTAAVHTPQQDGDTLKGLVWGGGKWLSPAAYREYAEKKAKLPKVTDAQVEQSVKELRHAGHTTREPE